MKRSLWVVALALLLGFPAPARGADGPFLDPEVVAETTRRLIERHGEAHAERIRQGVGQVAGRWWSRDGDAAAFARFCEEQFVTDRGELDRAAGRLERVLEQIDGHLHEIRREILTPVDLDTGPVSTLDRLLTDVDLATHVDEDLFRTRVAFHILLNFPVHTLSERLAQGARWDRETWARSRMTERFALRVPASVAQEISGAFNAASQYVADYKIRTDLLISPRGERLFPGGPRLTAHWGLRDELKSQYSEGEQGLLRQRTILRVMERIVRQEIPVEAIDRPDRLWCPETNELKRSPDSAEAVRVDPAREPDTRYARLLDVFRAVRQADPYSPTASTFIDRRFELERQIPEAEVEKLLVSLLESDEFADLAELIRRRLGRPLEPFDIWYDGFTTRGALDEGELDRRVSARYPDARAFQAELPAILTGLGFTESKARWLAERIVVDPSRGAGHAMGAMRREDKARLRTRIEPGGMDYKGYNIAIHELGHNVEQVFSLNAIDSWWLNGVPNTAFTEALAFTFQNRDLELLGLESPGPQTRLMEALDTLWGTAEIGAVALVDMKVWRWMYEHPEATPAELRQATLAAAREVWNRYLSEAFGVRDQEVLAIYSHMIAYGLYLPDYPIGHIIAFQVAAKMREGDFGSEFERVARQGRLTPDAWMRGAVGAPISARPLLAASREALDALGGANRGR